MLKTDDIYKSLVKDPASSFSVGLLDYSLPLDENGGIHTKLYTSRVLKSISVEQPLLGSSGKPGIGGCACGQMWVTMRDPLMVGFSSRPEKMGMLIPYVYPTKTSENEYLYGSTLYPSKFFIDTREFDEDTGDMTLHCYDAMAAADQDFYYNGKQTGWNIPDSTAIFTICELMTNALTASGTVNSDTRVSVDDETYKIINKNYRIAYPEGEAGPYSCREILGQIAALYGGNWIIAPDNSTSKLVGTVNMVSRLKLVLFGQEQGGKVLGTEKGGLILANGQPLLMTEDPAKAAESDSIFYAGMGAHAVNAGKPTAPYTRVSLDLGTTVLNENTLPFHVIADADGGEYFSAGDYLYDPETNTWQEGEVPETAGSTLEGSCPLVGGDYTGTALDTTSFFEFTRMNRAMKAAKNILQNIQGYIYRPFTASGVVYDPAVQPGDAIEIGKSLYSVVGYMRVEYAEMCTAEIIAPGGDELENEMDFHTSQSRMTDRKLQSAATTGGGSVLSMARTEYIDLSHIYAGYWTEKIEGDDTVYSNSISIEDGRITTTAPDGKTMVMML